MLRSGVLAAALALAFPSEGWANPSITTDSLLNQAAELRVERRDSEAEPLVREALRRAERQYGVDAAPTQLIVNTLAQIYLDLERIDEAGGLFERLIARTAQVYGTSHTDYAKYGSWLGDVRGRQGRYDEARILYKASRDGSAELRGPTNREVGNAEFNLGATAAKIGDHKAAVDHLRAAVRIFALQPNFRPWDLVQAQSELGRALRNTGQTDEAISVMEALYRQLNADPHGNTEILPLTS